MCKAAEHTQTGLAGQPQQALESLVSLQDYRIFFPLSRNTNIKDIEAAGDNVTTLAYMEKPSDCSYGPATVSTASVGSSRCVALQQAPAPPPPSPAVMSS